MWLQEWKTGVPCTAL